MVKAKLKKPTSLKIWAETGLCNPGWGPKGEKYTPFLQPLFSAPTGCGWLLDCVETLCEDAACLSSVCLVGQTPWQSQQLPVAWSSVTGGGGSFSRPQSEAEVPRQSVAVWKFQGPQGAALFPRNLKRKKEKWKADPWVDALPRSLFLGVATSCKPVLGQEESQGCLSWRRVKH